MKQISMILSALLLSPILYSCNGNRSEEEDIIMEDFFLGDTFEPNNDVKQTINESLSSLSPNIFDYFGDSISITIHCRAMWNTSRNTNPYSIKINEVDTDWFFVTINEDFATETTMDWEKPSYRPILRTIKTILDAGTYVLCCMNIDDITPQSILNMYHDFDSIAMTDIYFKMYLKNGKS